jgi:chromosome segregation ATPase
MVRTLEFVEQLNDNLLATISDYALRMAEAKADLAHYKSLHATQEDSILSLYAKLDEAEAARDEATARATHAEEELAFASWQAEENLRCCELRDVTIDALEGEIETTRKAIKAAENACSFHEERATNAEYNAKHYWRELQAETNKARMYRQERDFERRRYDEAMRPTLTFNAGIGLTATRSGSASDGIGKG